MSFGQMSDFVDAKAVISAAQNMVEGADIKFRMDAQGVVTDFPKASAAGGELDPMVQMALETILGALKRSIHPVPAKALTTGATWQDQKVTGRKGKLGRFKETTTSSSFKGLFRPKDSAPGVQIARIQQEDKTSTVTTTIAAILTASAAIAPTTAPVATVFAATLHSTSASLTPSDLPLGRNTLAFSFDLLVLVPRSAPSRHVSSFSK